MKYLIIPMVAMTLFTAQPAKAFIPIVYAATVAGEVVWECGKRSVCRKSVTKSVTSVSKWGIAGVTAIVSGTATVTSNLIKKWID